jgi:predicted  nucleic acid-binding Zn-ribbon protein
LKQRDKLRDHVDELQDEIGDLKFDKLLLRSELEELQNPSVETKTT